MKIIYEPIINLSYLFLLTRLVKSQRKWLEHYINFDLIPVDTLNIPNVKIIY